MGAKSKWLAGAGVLVAACIVAVLYLTGFCFSQMRYIGDDEFIEHALLARAAFIKGLANPATAEDVRNYRRANPNCCRIEGATFPLSSTFADRLRGSKTTWVRVLHELTDEQAAKYKGDSYYEAFIALDRCGNAFRTSGQSLPESEAKPQL